MTERNTALEPFEALIGTWDTEATHPMIEGTHPGWWSFELLTGDQFLVVRSHNDHELFPDAIAIIGAPETGDGLVMEYFDSRGVRRTYGTAIENGVWRWWRDHPGFDQRQVATLAPDTFELVSKLAREPGEWKDDLKVVFRRRP
jgi:hypothetical protein